LLTSDLKWPGVTDGRNGTDLNINAAASDWRPEHINFLWLLLDHRFECIITVSV